MSPLRKQSPGREYLSPVRRKRQRGIALLMVLIALTILGAMTADLMEANEVYLATTVNMRDATQAEYLARSGVNLSRLLLSFQSAMGRTLNFPIWQYADLVIEMFADPEGGGMLAELAGADLSDVEGLGLGIPDSDLQVAIIDEDSKLNINMANTARHGARQRRQMIQGLAALMAPIKYDQLFDRKAEDGDFLTRDDVICEIVDWSDPDEDLCNMSGSEDRSVYQSLEPAYERKNAPYDSLEELHFVRGVDDDFWSAFVDPVPEEPERRVMTVWGKGKINVNTAPPQLLFMAVCMLTSDEAGVGPCMDLQQRMAILQLLDVICSIRMFMPFSGVRDFLSTLQNPEERLFGLPIPGLTIVNRSMARRMLTTRSTVFSIYAEGTVGRVTKRIHTVVDMQGRDMLDPAKSVAASGGSVLYWRME